jgi:hypothetical protein
MLLLLWVALLARCCLNVTANDYPATPGQTSRRLQSEHIAVDTGGHPGCGDHRDERQDRQGARPLLWTLHRACRKVRLV